MGNWVDPRNPKGRRRKSTNIIEGKDFEVKKGQSLKEEGYPHSTRPSSQPTGKAQPATRNYIKEAFDKYTGGDYSKIKATNMAGEVILDRMRGNTKWTKEGAMKARKAHAQLNGKGSWSAEEEMRKRREAAQKKKQKREEWERSNEDQYRTESGVWQNTNKKRWSAEEEMRKRREAARANGKGNWNAQEEMEKRRKASRTKKQNDYSINAPKRR